MKKAIQKFYVKYPILAAVISVFLALTIFHTDVWIFHFDFFQSVCHTSETTAETIKRILTSIILMAFFVPVFDCSLKEIGYTFKNSKDGFKTAIIIIIVAAIYFGFKCYSSMADGISHIASTPAEISAAVEMFTACFFVGIFEETAYRVLSINILRNKKIDDDRKKLFFCLIISAILFGLIHLANFFGGYDTVYACISRIVNAIGVGMVFGAIYWKCGSILPSILLHFVWDSLASLSEYLFIPNETASAGTTGPATIIAGAVFMLIWIVVALVILRKKKYKGCMIETKTLQQ